MKNERIAQLELLLRSHPEGLRRIEIAKRLGMHRSSIGRYINDLKKYIDIYEENNIIKIRKDPNDNEELLALSIYESLAFNMSAEALSQNQDLQTPHLASGLRKLALSMKSYAPLISDNILRIASNIETKVQEQENVKPYKTTLEVLIDSWVTGKIVRITHRVNSIEEETEFAPYFIGFTEDDNSNRQAVTVTGRLRHTSEIATIKITNITNAVILDEIYTIPDNLKAFKLPESSFKYEAIDMIPLTLVLKEKSALNAFRLLAHTEPVFSKNKENEIICEIEIENSIELFLRIIQCGNSVKVIKPEKYRNKIKNKLNEVISMY